MTDENLYWAMIDVINGLLTGTFIGGYYAAARGIRDSAMCSRNVS